MNSIIIKNNFPLKAWKEIIEEFQNGVPLFVETDLNNLDTNSNLFNKFYNHFKWHFRDSHRSMNIKMERNLTPYEFSYYNRMREYFGIDQLELNLKNKNNIICNWDNKKDYISRPKPCFVTGKFIQEDNYLHFSCTFRTRDVIKRLYPNYISLRLMLEKCAEQHNLKLGKLFDYSNQIIAQKDLIEEIESWQEFIDYDKK